ncbi:MAG: lyase family protein, partial [Myxococcota bacterium]
PQIEGKFVERLRILQSPVLGEWSEPFGKRQVGSSAMPFKRNPINAENINSQARLLAALPRVAWDNAAHSLLERTLDDSANRRTVLPESFLIADELLRRGLKLVRGLKVDVEAAERLLATYGTFAATERLMMEAVKRGGNRQELHEVIREHSLAAWAALRTGASNPLVDALCGDTRLTAHVPADEARALLNAAEYLGDAPERAQLMASALRTALD